MENNNKQAVMFECKKITIRRFAPKDLKQAAKFQKFINELVAEDAQILICAKKTKKEEVEWLKGVLSNVKKRRAVYLLAERDGAIVGCAHIGLGRERESHVGTFGISVSKDYRGIGLGRRLMGEIINLAKKGLNPRPKIIRLSVYQGNFPAMNLYRKFGFKQVALIPRQIQFRGKLINELIMLLDI